MALPRPGATVSDLDVNPRQSSKYAKTEQPTGLTKIVLSCTPSSWSASAISLWRRVAATGQ